ncbi:uncharacterized protein [Apostichopus japonicus]|uniref:uncharacterized protein isoform X2 n=1 Tax=Stichopus japonicus TaxID=307972 RepID=UPI003AB34F53
MSRRRRTSKSEEERAVDACLKGEDIEGFRLGFIDEFIGSGVICEKRFKKGDFLLEYRGELISQEEGEHREANYPEEVGSFLYFFCHKGKTKCIDATDSCGNGRMVNDGKNLANCKMRIVTVEGRVPKLCLFALKDIEEGSKLRCYHGVSDIPRRKRIQMETNKVPQESSSEQSEEAKDLTHYPEENRDSSEVFQQLSEASSSKTINKEANIIAGKSKQPPRYKKPLRMCPFCGKYFKETLTRHLKLVHKDEEQVKRALELPKKERVEAFALMRKEGILQANILQMKVDNPKYETQRRAATENPLVICGLCKGFYATRYFGRHKAICQGDSCLQACSVPVSLVTPECRVNQNISEFQRDILRRFKEDEVGEVCRSDPFIVDIGKRLLDASRNKEDKKTEVRKHVMSDMRRLASLYRCFKEQHEIHGTGPLESGTARDMFQRGNFNCLTEAISSYSGESNELKSGLKIALYYLLKKSCKIVKATHLVEGQDACAEEIDQFVATLELNRNYLFDDAKYQGNKNSQANLRNPAALPLEEAVKKLRNYISSVITTMMEDDVIVWDSYNFEKLRDVVVARLTLFNAKHGGEPCRLSIEEWKEAMADAWIDETQADAISDPIEEHMLTKLKVTYQTVRGNNRLVPVLFPDDCIPAIEVLTSSAARSSAGVLASNGCVFPRIQSSTNHVMGWHALSGICHDAEVSSKTRLTATRNRHHISTLYASMDVPVSERASYLKHMGYSTDVSENIDEAPPAVKEVVEVGQPQQIDAAKKRKCSEEVKAETKKKRKYTKWTKNDEELVEKHFHLIITEQTTKHIPYKAQIEAFKKLPNFHRCILGRPCAPRSTMRK